MAPVRHYPALIRSEDPECTVCIANYNGVHLLADCIASVLSQSGVNVEIVIHDDASTDGSVRWIIDRFPQVELMASPENVGFCVANNRMVAHARGRFVLLLNNDAALYPDALKSLVDASARSDAVLTLPQFDWSSGSIVDRGCLLDLFYNPVPNLDCERTEVAMAIGACLFLSRDLWNSIGGFPEWFGSIGEDMYLCCLARLWGVPVKVVQKSGYRHRQGATFGGNRANDGGGLVSTYRRRALSERNKTLVMSICTPGAAAWAILCLHSILLGLEGVVLSILKGDRRIWKEIYYPACTYVPGKFGLVKAFRQKVQSKRRTRTRDYFAEFTIVPRKLVLLWRHGVPVVR